MQKDLKNVGKITRKGVFSRAENSIIFAVIRAQSTDVDVVIGAAFSSNCIQGVVANALGIWTAEKGHDVRHSH